MKDYNALKSLTTYLQVKDFIIENSHLFSDTAFKVILNLFSRVNFNLSNCYAPMSFTELRQRTAKTNQSLQRAIKELQEKGLIVKISGKYNPDTAIYTRAVAYNSPQKPVRSYNETNVYDLTNLVILAGIYYKLAENFEISSVREFFHQVRKYNEITGKPYLSILSGVLITEENQGGYANRHRGMPIGKSDMPIGIGVCLIGKSDMPIGKEPFPVNQSQKPHTHTTQDSVGDEEKGLSDSNSNSQTQNKTLEEKPAFSDKKVLNITEELKEYIMADLIRQEQAGKINSANAVFKSLSDEDIKMYEKKMIQEQQQKKREQYKVIAISKLNYEDETAMKTIFGKNYKEVFEKKKEKFELKEFDRYVYILVKSTAVEKIRTRANVISVELAIYEYDEKYEKIFAK